MSENRFIAVSFSLLMLAIGLVIGLYFGGLAWIVAALPLWFAWTSLKIGLRATEKDLSKFTGDLPEMTDDELREFSERIDKD